MSVSKTRNDIRLLLNGSPVSVSQEPVHTTLLTWLRARGLTATKEGCAEGDCGACTVLLGTPGDAGFDFRAVNACLVLVGQADGRAVVTAEGLDANHPAPALLAEKHGTQCGFCSPGFTMSLAGLARQPKRDDETILDAIAGNLCRCTGYRPIVDAARALPEVPAAATEAAVAERLTTDTAVPLAYQSAGGQRLAAPESLEEALAFLAANPTAWIWSGGTDLGLRITKRLEQPEAILSLGRIAALKKIEKTAAGLTLGAAVSYNEALPELAALAPAFGGLVQRIAAVQIRNIGTIGGNLGNASPIGDSLPPLIAASAELELVSAAGTRRVAMEDFITGYRKTVLQPGELIAAIHIPQPSEATAIRCYKVAKRYDQDISAVSAAFALTLEDGVVIAVRAAFGGVAARPVRATSVEAALTGQPWTLATAEAAAAAAAADISPMDDVRGSAAYRRSVAANLVLRLWHDTAGETAIPTLDALTSGVHSLEAAG